MGLDDGTSQHSGRGSYIHSSGSPPPYLSSRSPNPMGPGHPYNSYSENIVYTPMIGKWSLLTEDMSRALQWTVFFLNLQPHLEVPFWARIGAPARTWVTSPVLLTTILTFLPVPTRGSAVVEMRATVPQRLIIITQPRQWTTNYYWQGEAEDIIIGDCIGFKG